MTLRVTLAIAVRVLTQLRRDHRTLAMLLVLPCLLQALLWWIYEATPMVFDRIGPALLAIFRFFVMFLVTSVTTLRERTSGTLERLLSSIGKPYVVNGKSLLVAASVGYTLYPLDESEIDELVQHADKAMYRSKLNGGSNYHRYDPSDDSLVRENKGN